MPDELRLSLSKSKTFTDCAKKYHYTYIQKLPQKEFIHHKLGKFLHKILEDFHLVYINGSEKPYNITMSECFKAAKTEFILSSESQKEAYEMIDNYLKYIANDNSFIKTIIAVEKRFDFHITDNVVLNGMIDRIQLDTDGIYHVADYKTTKNKKYLKNDWLQLQTYAYVILTENPNIERVRGSYILLRHNFEHITKEFTKGEIQEIKNKYETYAKQIEEEQLWRANPTKLCAWCSFLDVCDEGNALINPKLTHGETNW